LRFHRALLEPSKLTIDFSRRTLKIEAVSTTRCKGPPPKVALEPSVVEKERIALARLFLLFLGHTGARRTF